MIEAIISSGGMIIAASPVVAQTAEDPSVTLESADAIANDEVAKDLDAVGVVGLRRTI